jgi:hypothetical protein
MPRKMEPVVSTLHFDIGQSNLNYIDLAKALSEVNRRFYRQGMNYAIGGLRFGYVGAENPAVNVKFLPNSWPVGAAWHKFFAKWQEQQNEALAASGSLESKSRYNDFKIYMDQFMKTATNLRPISPGGFSTTVSPFKEGEWQYSNVVVPNDGSPGNSVEYACHMVGASGTQQAGMIVEYGLSRNLPFSPDPNTPDIDTSILSRMFDVGDNMTDIVENAIDKNDDVPYDLDEYPFGSTNNGNLMVHREIQFTATTIGGHQDMPGGVAPCGLIQVVHDLSAATNNTTTWLTMQVILIPGEYKGVLAEPMQVMN